MMWGSSISTEHQMEQSSLEAIEYQYHSLNKFQDDIQSRFSAYENYQMKLFILKYYEGKIPYEKLRESIESLLANDPDLLIRFQDLITTPWFKSHQDDKHEIQLSSSVNTIAESQLHLQSIDHHSLCEMLTCRSADYNSIKDLALSRPDSARERNQKGQLPLHIACIKGYPYHVILALVEAYPDALAVSDNTGRLPLHYYLTIHSASYWVDSIEASIEVNSRRNLIDLSVDAVKLLAARQFITLDDSFGFCPLKCFALECHFIDINDEKSIYKAKEVIDAMIDYDPPFSIFLFKKIRTYPNAFVMHVANNKFIKTKLNQAACSFLFIATILLDLTTRIFLILSFAAMPSLRERLNNTNEYYVENILNYIGSFYLLFRVILRMWSFKESGNLIDWTKSGWRWLTLVEYLLVMTATIRLHLFPRNDNGFVLALTTGVQWLSLLIVLRPASMHFVQFWSGIVNVIKTLLPYAITTYVLLAAVVFMFYFLNKYSCEQEDCLMSLGDIIRAILIESINGEIEKEEMYEYSISVFFLVFTFGFIALILHRNILIAIVLESYSAARSMGEEIFWLERLVYVSELEVIFSSCVKCRRSSKHTAFCDYLECHWNKLLLFLFHPKRYDLQLTRIRKYKKRKTNWSRISTSMCRLGCLFVVLPLWIIIGFLTFGWFLPPQVHRYLLEEKIENPQNENETIKSDIELLETSIVKHMKQFEKRENAKLANLQAELEVLRAQENLFQSIDLTIRNLDEISSCREGKMIK